MLDRCIINARDNYTTSLTLITHIAPLEAAASSGTIVSYTIQTIPPAEQGILYAGVDENCTPGTARRLLTPDPIGQLSFHHCCNPIETIKIVKK